MPNLHLLEQEPHDLAPCGIVKVSQAASASTSACRPIGGGALSASHRPNVDAMPSRALRASDPLIRPSATSSRSAISARRAPRPSTAKLTANRPETGGLEVTPPDLIASQIQFVSGRCGASLDTRSVGDCQTQRRPPPRPSKSRYILRLTLQHPTAEPSFVRK